MNMRLHPEEHAYMIDDAGAAPSSTPRSSRSPGAVRDRLPRVEHFISLGHGGGAITEFEALVAARRARIRPTSHRGRRDGVALLHSGTTGHPKGAILTTRACYDGLPVPVR
jgi:acyl-coenzyme A synthetase/AMP-(fatty) acid ligase